MHGKAGATRITKRVEVLRIPRSKYTTAAKNGSSGLRRKVVDDPAGAQDIRVPDGIPLGVPEVSP